MYIVAVHYLSSTITVFFTVRWNFILHVFDVNLHHYCCCYYKHIGPHPDMKYYAVIGKPLCQWLCLSVRNFVRLYIFFPIVYAWDITLCTGKKGWFSPEHWEVRHSEVMWNIFSQWFLCDQYIYQQTIHNKYCTPLFNNSLRKAPPVPKHVGVSTFYEL